MYYLCRPFGLLRLRVFFLLLLLCGVSLAACSLACLLTLLACLLALLALLAGVLECFSAENSSYQ